MADDSDTDKTEKATSYKLRKAREKGSVARGGDLGIVGALAGLVGYGWMQGDVLQDRLGKSAMDAIVIAPRLGDGADALGVLVGRMLGRIVEPLALLAGSIWLMVLVVEILQTGPVFTTEKLKPDFSRLNPARGLRRLFTVQTLILGAKSLAKFAVYALVGWLAVMSVLAREVPLITDAAHLAAALMRTAYRLLLFLLLAAFLIAVADQLLARRQFGTQMRSSRRELRREIKDREGDPRIRQRRRQLHREFAKMARSLGQIRGADVVIVNPVHYAVALRYRPNDMVAPKVVARGAGTFAVTLKRIAFHYSVVVIHDAALARELYERGMIDREITPEFYTPVAKIYRRQDVKNRGARA